MKDGIYNARVEKANLWFEDHGCLCFDLEFVHQGGHQSFGGINLMNQFTKKFERTGGNVAGWYIKRIFDICGAERYDDLKGKTVRVKIEDGIIRAIGNIILDDWFEPRVDFAEK